VESPAPIVVPPRVNRGVPTAQEAPHMIVPPNVEDQVLRACSVCSSRIMRR
jgi:hypothetical protein